VKLNNKIGRIGLSVTDFEFIGGILFPDKISLNFSLTIDPDEYRAVGSGKIDSSIVMHPLCRQSQFLDWPAKKDTYVSCGSMASESFISRAKGTLMTDIGNIIYFLI
jgi:hypothetical protein